MKLSHLFGRFLYQNRQINLPGIGVFSIDPNVTIPELTEKNSQEVSQHIKFVQKNVSRPDEEFIDFIRTHTGKIRPLAESDLESFLSDGKILLNIGKPFHLEGIGTLQKNREGRYDFFPGSPSIDRLDTYVPEKETKASVSKPTYEQEYIPGARSVHAGRTFWIAFAILLGLGAIIFGGYSLYNRNTDNEGMESTVTTSTEPAVTDTPRANPVDSVTAVSSAISANTSVSSKPYKFIFRLASRNYVIRRYEELKPYNPNLFWDTKDSTVYRLYIAIPAASKDTARIRDSLQEWFGTKKVLIEQ